MPPQDPTGDTSSKKQEELYDLDLAYFYIAGTNIPRDDLEEDPDEA